MCVFALSVNKANAPREQRFRNIVARFEAFIVIHESGLIRQKIQVSF